MRLRAAAERVIFGQIGATMNNVTRSADPLVCYLATMAFAVGTGCGQSDINNPTGMCGTRSDGARAGYHAPAENDIWVPDCQNPLAREYWRVFSQDGGTGYVIPRPDGTPELQLLHRSTGRSPRRRRSLRAVLRRW